MTQTAIVTAVSGDGRARVEVRRQSACGHDCERCAGCGTAAAIQVGGPDGPAPGGGGPGGDLL